MNSPESKTLPGKPPLPLRLEILMEAARRRRYRENGINTLKFVAVVLALLFTGWIVTLAIRPEDWEETSLFFLFLGIGLFVFPIHLLIRLVVFFWPFLLYFWAGIRTVRQRTLLSLVQTSLETKTPLAYMIRAYAVDCYSPPFRKRLERFASLLEDGYSLEQALEWDRGLFRFDVVGMIRLGGDDPETLQAVEEAIRDERDYSSARGMSIIRVAYFLSLIIPLLGVVSFMLYAIAPKLEVIFQDFEMELPAMTQLVLACSERFVKYWPFAVLLVELVILFLIFFLIIQTGIVVWRPPLIRRAFRDTDSGKLLRMLALGLKHHVPVNRVLQLYGNIVPSHYLRKRASRMEDSVMSGRDWIESLKRERLVTGPEASLLETARRTGNTTVVLDQLALGKERAQLRRDDQTSKLVFIPSLLGLGLVVGIFVIAMFIPLIKLTTVLSDMIY